MLHRRFGLVIGGLLGAGAVGMWVAVAGPLDPPAGPVGSTLKTLAEVEPRIAINATNTPGDATAVFRITAPGSYYLPANGAGVAGRDGIRVLADNVTIDLGGFTLQGVAGSLSGITSDGLADNVVVLNGTVRNWGVSGIDLMANAGFATGTRIEGVHAIGNGQRGISVPAETIVSGCFVSLNGAEGIRVRSFLGSLGQGVVESCEASNNAGIGIFVAAGTRVADCSAIANAGGGIATQADCLVTDCLARANSGFGISLGIGASARRCTSSATSGGSGIIAAGGGVVEDCACGTNTAGAGIRVTGARVRVEGNHCTSNATGILAESTGAFIVRNTCSGNSSLNWSIVAGNYFAAIHDLTGVFTTTVNGNGAAGLLPTTDPNANFTY